MWRGSLTVNEAGSLHINSSGGGGEGEGEFLPSSSGALAREERSRAPWVKKCGKLLIRENLVIT